MRAFQMENIFRNDFYLISFALRDSWNEVFRLFSVLLLAVCLCVWVSAWARPIKPAQFHCFKWALGCALSHSSMRLTFILYYQWGSAPPFDWMEWWFPIGEIDETLSFELYLHFMSSHHHHHFPTIYHHRQSVTNGSTWSENGAEQFLFILFKILHSVFKVNRNT